ncbi:MAG: tetrathionate reductase family octaheme c-type cytochrome [Pseudomonadota bacterium]
MRVLLLLVLILTGAGEARPVVAAADQARTPAPSARERMPAYPAHTDHKFFFAAPFTDGPSVTRACLQCHPEAAHEVMQTTHWNWQGDEVNVPGHEGAVRIGKRNVINNFCIGVQSNWPACTMCHIGYGWEDENFDFQDASRVDCLVCHDNSGTYVKKFRGAGVPDESVDLLTAARSVGMPRRQNCGGCHFQGGGGNAVKHGDMDETLLFPSERIDVHMGKYDMACIDCHRTEHHRIRGRAMAVSVDAANRVACTDCHESQPHSDVRLNAHTARLACQTCHIPHMAADTGTKMSWDWSEAGQDLDITDSHRYLKIKGRFTWAKKVRPEYYWYNETSTRYITGDLIDPDKPTRITAPLGSRDDPTAKIWPFKVHRGKQPYDSVNKYFLVPNVHGDKGFWTAFDWKTALQTGSHISGLTYSGNYAFAPTEMFFPLSHMVTSPDEALQCRDCHGERSRLDWVALGYPGDPLGRPHQSHDPVYLNDADGVPVAESGAPLSVAETCGLCHELEDEAFVASHAYHGSIQDEQLPPERRQLMVDGPRIPADAASQMNCFLCHLQQPDLAARQAALDAGMPEWSVSATLAGTGLISATADGYRWNAADIDEDGAAAIDLRPVTEAQCGNCHGVVHDGSDPLLVNLGTNQNWTTETTGQVFSPQPIRLSGMNHAGKDDLDLVWDVHAERLVTCGDCHYSSDRPARLAGTATPASVAPAAGLKRRCESCHSLEGTHTWLPEAARHYHAVTCESCHVPRLEMGARESIDGTVMLPDGVPLVSYRGIDDTRLATPSNAYITGYTPLLRVGRSEAGANRVMPYNLVTHWYWTDGDGHEPIAAAALRAAWLGDDGYPAEVLEIFDTNGDGKLERQELRLDDNTKLMFIKERLRAAGVNNPQIRGEVRAYHIHHNIRHGDRVSRDCGACHPDGKTPLPGFELAPYVPGGVKPVLMQDTTRIILDGSWETTPQGGLRFAPTQGAATSWQAHENTIRSEP